MTERHVKILDLVKLNDGSVGFIIGFSGLLESNVGPFADKLETINAYNAMDNMASIVVDSARERVIILSIGSFAVGYAGTPRLAVGYTDECMKVGW